MLSKFSIWDFFKKIDPKEFNNFDLVKIKVLQFEEDLSFELIKRNYINTISNIQRKSGKELTFNSLSDYFATNDLFNLSSLKLIYDADDIPKNACEWLIKNYKLWNTENIIFIFKKNNTLSSFLEKLSEESNGLHFFRVESVKFWQSRECLDFLLMYFNLELKEKDFSLFLENIPFNFNDYYNYVSQLAVGGIEELASILDNINRDQFYYSQLINKRDLQTFFKHLPSLIKEQKDFTEFRLLLNFLQSHFFKLLDPSYVKEKKRPSKYDQEIQIGSKKWNLNDIDKFIWYLSEQMIGCKKQDPFLFEKIFSNYLKMIK